MTVLRHWLVLPVDPEGEPFIAWGSVEADEYKRQPAVYRVEEYVRADQLTGAVSAMREAAELLEDTGTPEYVNPPTAEAMQRVAVTLRAHAGGQSMVRCTECRGHRPQDVIDCPVCDVPRGHVHGRRDQPKET